MRMPGTPAVLWALAAAGAAGAADDAPTPDDRRRAEALYADVFGPEDRRAAQAPKADRLKFARRLADRMKSPDADPALAAVLAEKAAAHAAGDASLLLEIRRFQLASGRAGAAELAEAEALLGRALRTGPAGGRSAAAADLVEVLRRRSGLAAGNGDWAAASAALNRAKAVVRSSAPAESRAGTLAELESEERALAARRDDAHAEARLTLASSCSDPTSRLLRPMSRLREWAAACRLRSFSSLCRRASTAAGVGIPSSTPRLLTKLVRRNLRKASARSATDLPISSSLRRAASIEGCSSPRWADSSAISRSWRERSSSRRRISSSRAAISAGGIPAKSRASPSAASARIRLISVSRIIPSRRLISIRLMECRCRRSSVPYCSAIAPMRRRRS